MSPAGKFSITIVDTRDHEQARHVLTTAAHVMQNLVDLSTVYWFSDQPFNSDLPVHVQWIKIGSISQMPQDYNQVVLKLLPCVATQNHNMIIQTDGYPVNPEAWTNEFLSVDYIGAVWPWESMSVGNGGFSMRSRKLLDALMHLDLQAWMNHPEDAVIGRHLRPTLEQQFGIKYADPELADRFSIEWNTSSPWMGRSFGFHGQHPAIVQAYQRA